jgi:integrase
MCDKNIHIKKPLLSQGLFEYRVITTHDFRSTFRDWSADKTDYPREVCEHVLAHKLPDEVEAAYLRGAYLEKRKGLMGDWANFCNVQSV